MKTAPLLWGLGQKTPLDHISNPNGQGDLQPWRDTDWPRRGGVWRPAAWY